MPFCDIVFVQKALIPVLFIKLIRLCGKKVAFDFDDAIYVDKITAEPDRRELRLFETTARSSDLIILENEATAAFAKKFNGNLLKITGPIDTDRYKPARKTGPVCIGWIGGPSTTFYLKPLLRVLGKLRANLPETRFLFIGAHAPELEDFAQYCVTWSLGTEVEQLSKLDIGIMPLPDNAWTRGKGGYKVLQYMAMGLPSVASPVEINKELIDTGKTGFLADSDETWLKALTSLAENAALRLDMGVKARGIAVKKYSFYAAAPLLKENLERILSDKK